MEKAPDRLREIFPCWEKLTAQQKTEIEKYAEEWPLKKGQSLHRGGNDCVGLCLVKQGQLRVFILSETGREITLYRLFAWDICLFSASCIMKNISFELHVEAEKDTSAFIVPAHIYEELMKSSLPVADYTNQLMASRFSDVMWVMEQVLFTSFDSRLANFLLEQSTIDESDVLAITHDEIARHIGSAREVVTKMLNYLANEELLQLSRGKITLLNKEKLQALIQ
ncbi:MAG: Crp/Fnr family transcriptional regulator [Christensenellales bacterium]